MAMRLARYKAKQDYSINYMLWEDQARAVLTTSFHTAAWSARDHGRERYNYDILIGHPHWKSEAWPQSLSRLEKCLSGIQVKTTLCSVINLQDYDGLIIVIALLRARRDPNVDIRNARWVVFPRSAVDAGSMRPTSTVGQGIIRQWETPFDAIPSRIKELCEEPAHGIFRLSHHDFKSDYFKK